MLSIRIVLNVVAIMGAGGRQVYESADQTSCECRRKRLKLLVRVWQMLKSVYDKHQGRRCGGRDRVIMVSWRSPYSVNFENNDENNAVAAIRC